MAELLGNCLARWLRETYPKELPLVVPVPASPAGRRRRGFDQSFRLARILERRYGAAVCRALRRTGRRQQKQLDYEARSRNLRGAISVARRRQPTLPKTVLVLDDVFTTGATVNECARVLREAGVETVDAVTLAAD
ncbi:MAG: ComF family protein [Spirochaetaceae bacterium]